MAEPSRLLHRLDKPAWAMSGGVLLALGLPPLGLFPLAWVALVPLLVRWARLKHAWTLFREAYVTFLLMSVGAGFWVLLHEAMAAALLSGLGLLLLPLPHAAAFALSSRVRARHGVGVGFLALACNVLAVEFLAAHVAGGLPWLLLGHTQAAALPFNQTADLGGVGLLSLFVLVVNFIGLLFAQAAPRPGLLPGGRTLLALLLLALLSGAAVYGDDRVAGLETPEVELAVALVQPAEPTAVWANATDWTRVERLADLSDRLLPEASSESPFRSIEFGVGSGPRLLVWPEIALPPLPDRRAQGRLYQRLALWSAARETDLLTGALTHTSGEAFQNTALFLRNEDEPPQSYAKVYLTPLVEYIPFLDRSPLLGAMTLPEDDARLSTGSAPGLFAGDGYEAGAVIGFESLRGDYVRRLVGAGADVVVTLAENGWWGRSPGSGQHLGLTRLRAIETRRTVVVATVSGTSAIVYPDGAVEPLAGWMERDVIERQIPLQETPSLYVRHGDWPGRFALWGAGGFLLVWGAGAVSSRVKPLPRKRARA